MACQRLRNAERGPSYTVDNSAPNTCLTPTGIQGHPNFALETVELPFSPIPDGKSVCSVERRADLLHKCYLVFNLPRVTGKDVRWCTDVGFALVRIVQLFIGGAAVDEQTGEFMYIWNALTLSADESASLSDMVNVEDSWMGKGELPEQKVYVPLNFTYCDESDNALPIALHEITINLETRSLESLLEGEVETIHEGAAVKLSCDYITLEERGREQLCGGARPQHSLIKRTQSAHFARWSGKHRLHFSDECVELFIVCRSLTRTRTPSDMFNFADKAGKNPVRTGVLTLDAERIELTGKYMNSVQPFQYHTGYAPAGVNILTFCLHPEQQRVSGSCNMSCVKEQHLELDMSPDEEWEVTVYARSHAVMSITQEMFSIR